jgi:acyl dehydratase
MPRLFLEDFEPGSASAYGGLTIDRDEMVAFARDFDPQPMHIDEKAAEGSMIGGLIASGWFTAALNMRMMAESFILDSASMGSPGVSELKWLRPVRAGDRLTGERIVLSRRASTSRPDRGFVDFRFVLRNQSGEPVLEQTNMIMFGRRTTGDLAPAGEPMSAPADTPLPAFVPSAGDTLPFLENVVVGEQWHLGDVHFDAEAITRFGRAYDPQPFHIDEAAGQASHFGTLIASGWQTGAAWMGRMVRSRGVAARAMAARGETPAELGPSPGIRNLKWIKPVRAGDTITYRCGLTSKRRLPARPGWGLVTHHNTGHDQNGTLVFSFDGAVLWQAGSA